MFEVETWYVGRVCQRHCLPDGSTSCSAEHCL